jgi:hypothetical protein
MKSRRLPFLSLAALAAAAALARADAPVPPEWSLPGSATHHQVPPPAGFRRATTTFDAPLGIFAGQSDIGTALVPGSASFDAASGRYTIQSAGYNIWYFRDEFRFLWRRMAGDASLAATIRFPNPDGYSDRKVVLIVRQDLDDDSKEAMAALHGGGLIHLATRPAKGADLREAFQIQGAPGTAEVPIRIGIEKRGDAFTLYLSRHGEPMHAEGSPAMVHFDEPYYIGIGFTSHQPVTSDAAAVSDVVLENRAGAVR